jgi:hypothetical protein
MKVAFFFNDLYSVAKRGSVALRNYDDEYTRRVARGLPVREWKIFTTDLLLDIEMQMPIQASTRIVSESLQSRDHMY